jgi:hypothetical protein
LTKIAVCVPTYRPGGIDIIGASLNRQTVKPDLVFIADTLHRDKSWALELIDFKKIWYINWIIKPENKRNLCASYNIAARQSLKEQCDLFISLQDYIYLPRNGIERFVKIHEANPNDLITGLTHISKDPEVDKIKDLEGSYTIFEQPFFDKPKEISWTDVRSEMYNVENYDILNVPADHWEANWAATPVDKFRQGIFWDEDYDAGIAYENIKFARECVEKTNCRVLLDLRNEAISLPHKEYWPEEKEEILKYSNRWRYESEYG